MNSPTAANALTQANLATFNSADTNHDGFVSSDELVVTLNPATNAARSKADFNTYDRNHDGRISADEWAQAMNVPPATTQQ